MRKVYFLKGVRTYDTPFIYRYPPQATSGKVVSLKINLYLTRATQQGHGRLSRVSISIDFTFIMPFLRSYSELPFPEKSISIDLCSENSIPVGFRLTRRISRRMDIAFELAVCRNPQRIVDAKAQFGQLVSQQLNPYWLQVNQQNFGGK